MIRVLEGGKLGRVIANTGQPHVLHIYIDIDIYMYVYIYISTRVQVSTKDCNKTTITQTIGQGLSDHS